MTMLLSGYICVRNAVELDYCLTEAAMSLLPVVDELIICDGESTDLTLALCDALQVISPKVRVVTYPWPNPHNDPTFWVTWLNFARSHCRYPMQITLDADEVLDPKGFDTIKRVTNKGGCAMFRRHNFWQDHSHLVPENRCCGEMVARLGPTDLYMPSDEPRPKFEQNVRVEAREYADLQIFHYGFIRKPEAFTRKSVAVQNMFFGSVDSRITEMETKGKKWNERDYFEGLPLRPYKGPHPEVAHTWLNNRGFKT